MSHSPDHEPSDDVLLVRPGKWTLLVVSLLRGERRRFTDLKRHAGGVSQKVLTSTLRELERDGFVTRTMFATIPPRVDYELTALGHELLALADEWRVFVARNGAAVEQARQRYDASGGDPIVGHLP